MPRSANETVPSQFRFQAEVLAKLDWLRSQWTTGIVLTRTQVLKALIDQEYTARGGPAGSVNPEESLPEAKPTAQAKGKDGKTGKRKGGSK